MREIVFEGTDSVRLAQSKFRCWVFVKTCRFLRSLQSFYRCLLDFTAVEMSDKLYRSRSYNIFFILHFSFLRSVVLLDILFSNICCLCPSKDRAITMGKLLGMRTGGSWRSRLEYWPQLAENRYLRFQFWVGVQVESIDKCVFSCKENRCFQQL